MKKFSLPQFIVIITALCIMFVFLCSCQSPDKIKYYSQKENYVSVTGTVSSVKSDEDFTALYIEFLELSVSFDDTCFKIVGENLKIAQVNGINDKLTVGEQVSFITAPKYFGDGYVMPIVSISINGECLLEFEEGYKNLLNWLSKE